MWTKYRTSVYQIFVKIGELSKNSFTRKFVSRKLFWSEMLPGMGGSTASLRIPTATRDIEQSWPRNIEHQKTVPQLDRWFSVFTVHQQPIYCAHNTCAAKIRPPIRLLLTHGHPSTFAANIWRLQCMWGQHAGTPLYAHVHWIPRVGTPTPMTWPPG